MRRHIRISMIGDEKVMRAWRELVLTVRDPLVAFLDSLSNSESVTVDPIASSLAYGIFGRYIVESSQALKEDHSNVEAHMKGMLSVLEDPRVQSLISQIQSSSPVLAGFANHPQPPVIEIEGGDTS